jgi:hypothetical protein
MENRRAGRGCKCSFVGFWHFEIGQWICLPNSTAGLVLMRHQLVWPRGAYFFDAVKLEYSSIWSARLNG